MTGQEQKAAENVIQPFAIRQYARIWMAALLLLTDFTMLLLAGLAGVWVRTALYELLNPPFYWTLVPLIFLFLLIYATQRLYVAVGLSPVEELRRLTISTSAVFLFITAVTFWVRTAEYYSRLLFGIIWVFALVTVPLGRWLMRIIAVRFGIWGEPAAIIGCGPQSQRVAEFLSLRARLGLRPVVFIDFEDPRGETDLALPRRRFGRETDLDERLNTAGIQTAILVSSELPPELQDAIVYEQYFKFRQLIIISNLDWIGSLGVTPHDLEGFLGLEVRQNLLNPWQQRLKRWMDILLSLIISLITLPFLLVIALVIRIDSPGKPLFGHMRIGRNGRKITVWKFRTMVSNADQALAEHLARNPQARSEWEANHKIKDDPRVTRIGKVLRKFSLDEFPQLLNVFKGEMSLVGPRPIVTSEIERYQKGFMLYKRVRPGITGLWQVSGRTDVSYDERVRFDEYYVRNWSIWLDIYIILRTFWAVIQRQGAY